MCLHDAVSWGFRGGREVFASGQIGPVLESVLKGCENEQALFAGVFFLVSIVVLAWPARRRSIMTSGLPPALSQGVS
ncbi:MAG: hypothetical protein A2Z25_22065 [Planctomycetes bacterium RBG_16_55_9]|nr:MAG: hypothetical protein A2Z25_22065 [Planctomycetes bacterium RBG_16_55_9]